MLNNRLCFLCLGEHSQDVCTKPEMQCTVKNCKGKHHTLLHLPRPPRTTEVSRTLTVPCQPAHVLLRILPVQVTSKQGQKITTFAMLDGGSTCTLMHEDLANKIGINGKVEKIQLNTIRGDDQHDVQVSGCSISPTKSSQDAIQIRKLYVSRQLPLPDNQHRDAIDFSKWSHLKNLPLVEQVDHPHVTLLIGEDIPEAHQVLEYRYGLKKSDEPYAVRTKLGWYVSGPTGTNSENRAEVVSHVLKSEHLITNNSECCEEESNLKSLEKAVNKLWDEERHGFSSCTERTLSVDDREAQKIMEDTVKLESNGHYSVGMLWKSPHAAMPMNLTVARKCLNHLRI